MGRPIRFETLESRSLLTAGPSGPEFWVNDTTFGEQREAAIGSNAAGDFVVAWQSNEIPNFLDDTIFAQRFSAQGSRRGTEIRVNEAPTAGDLSPAVAVAPDGGFAVAWIALNFSFDAVVMARSFAPDGTPRSASLTLSGTVHPLGADRPSVAFDPQGNFVVGWNEANETRLRRIAPDGTPLGSTIVANLTGAYTAPSLAIDANGNFVVGWIGFRTAYVPILRRLAPDGQPLGGEIEADAFGSYTPAGIGVSVAADSDGDFAVTWTDHFDAHAQCFGADGQPRSPSVYLAQGSFNALPRVAIDRAGGYVFAWTSFSSSSSVDVSAQFYNDQGQSQSAPFRINTTIANIQSGVDVAALPGGGFVAAWDSNLQDGSYTGVFAQRFHNEPDMAGPQVANVYGRTNYAIPRGSTVPFSFQQMFVEFSEPPSIVGGTRGPGSVLNLANWRLLLDGLNVSQALAGVAVRPNSGNGRFQVVVSLSSPLTQGNYELVALDTITDPRGNRLDGDDNGQPGTNSRFEFSVSPISLTSESSVVTGGSGSETDAQVAIAPDGTYVVTWVTWDQGDEEVYARVYQPGGTPLTAAFRVTQNTFAPDLAPTVAIDPQGDFLIVWRNLAPNLSGYHLYGRRYNKSGQAISGQLVLTETAAMLSAAQIAMRSDGQFIVTWENETGTSTEFDVFYRRFDALGLPLGAEQSAADQTTGFQRRPAVAIDPQGDYVLGWSDYSGAGSSDVYVRRFDALGQPRDVAQRVNDAPLDGIATVNVAVASGLGEYAVGWHVVDIVQGRGSVFARRFDANGSPLGSEQLVETEAVAEFERPGLGYDEHGNAFIVWTRRDAQRYLDVWGRELRSTGALQAPFRVNDHTVNDQQRPALAASGKHFALAWDSWLQDGSSFRVNTSTLSTLSAPPRIGWAGVVLSGSSSVHADYAVPTGSGEQLRTVPLGQIDTVQLRFTKDVVVAMDDLTVSGSVNGSIAIADFGYDRASQLAFWRLAAPLVTGERITLSLSDEVIDQTGQALDGEFTNPTSLTSTGSFISGNAQPGGAFTFHFTTLPGDADRDNVVTTADFDLWAEHFDNGMGPAELLFGDGDFTGDGHVTGADYTLWADTFGVQPTVPNRRSFVVGVSRTLNDDRALSARDAALDMAGPWTSRRELWPDSQREPSRPGDEGATDHIEPRRPVLARVTPVPIKRPMAPLAIRAVERH